MALEGIEGGVDLKAADKAAKAAKAGLNKYKVWAKYTKKNPKHKEHCVHSKKLKSGNHPLVQALEKCGYHDVIMHHTPTKVDQWGSYRVNFKDMLTTSRDDFNIRVPDETGFLLPADDENCSQGCNNLQTYDLLRTIAKDAEARKKCVKFPFDGFMWKVVRKLERKQEGGAVLVGITRKRVSTLKEGFFPAEDENGYLYWQKWDGPVAVADEYYYKPALCHDVEVGGEYYVMTDKEEFTKLGVADHTPYTDQNEWDERCKNTLGWQVKVTAIYDGGDGWENYNATVQVVHGEGKDPIEAVVPIRALRKEQAGDTALFLGEVGQFIWKAEMDLFANKGFMERGKNIQPLCGEWAGIVYNYHGDERHFGDWADWVDLEDEECLAHLAVLKPEIAQFLRDQADNDYDDLHLGMN